MQYGSPHVVRGSTYLFRVAGDQLEPIRLPHEAAYEQEGATIRLKDPEAWRRGDYWADVAVEVELWQGDDGRVFCGAVDVRTVPGGPSRTEFVTQMAASNYLGPQVTAEVTARMWRQIPIGSLIEATMQGVREDAERYVGRVPAEVLSQWEAIAEGVPGRSKPGPKPLLTPEVLAQVVAPAYLAGGRRPVVAVQEALAAAGHNNGHVTLDMARKAVSRARQFDPPLIPPARTGRPRKHTTPPPSEH